MSSVALVRNAVSLLFILGLGACQAGAQSVPVGVVGYNHTDTRVAEFSVDIGAVVALFARMTVVAPLFAVPAFLPSGIRDCRFKSNGQAI